MRPTLKIIVLLHVTAQALNFQFFRRGATVSNSFPQPTRFSPIRPKFEIISSLLATIFLSAFHIDTSPAFAVQGVVKVSALSETQTAVGDLSKCIEILKSIETTDLPEKRYQDIADKLASPVFQNFEDIAGTIVRSEYLTQDEKTALGTIKRYGKSTDPFLKEKNQLNFVLGFVADAMIMVGGLKAELNAAGYVSKAPVSSLQRSLDVTSDPYEGDVDVDPPEINVDEVKKYVKLSKDSLQDIYTIVKPILKRSGK
jgi:hypothetical protein